MGSARAPCESREYLTLPTRTAAGGLPRFGLQGGGKITGRMRCCKAIRRSNIRYFLKSVWLYGRRSMTLHSTVLIPLVYLFGATVPCLAEDGSKQSYTCTAKAFNDCLMEAPCSAWKRLGPKDYKLETKIIFRGNPVEGETISGGTMGDFLETKCGKK